MDPNATRVNIEIGREMNLTEKKNIEITTIFANKEI